MSTRCKLMKRQCDSVTIGGYAAIYECGRLDIIMVLLHHTISIALYKLMASIDYSIYM